MMCFEWTVKGSQETRQHKLFFFFFFLACRLSGGGWLGLLVMVGPERPQSEPGCEGLALIARILGFAYSQRSRLYCNENESELQPKLCCVPGSS